jgi:acetyl esterase/lipase
VAARNTKPEQYKGTAFAAHDILNQSPTLCILIIALIISLISFPGCSSSDDSSDDAAQGSSVYTADSSGSSSLAMQWTPGDLLDGTTVSLYEDEIPNSISCDTEETTTGTGTSLVCYNVSVPTLTIYLPPPDLANGAAVIYCPGGGYSQVQYGGGISIAEEFNEQGIACFILKYRLPSDSTMEDKTIGPLQDAQQAIKIVRQRAEEWGIDPDKIGIMGYSAGGHLASTAGTHFNKSCIPNEENTDLRPDFMILVSSVISMDEDITHQGSRDSLLGEDPEEDLVESFSNELHITKDTPPAWIIHAQDDTTVSVENSIRFYEGLTDNSIPGELDLYPTGWHSVFWNLSADERMNLLLEWMSEIGIGTSD